MKTDPDPNGAEVASNALHRLEDALLAFLLLAMIVLASLQIGLRDLLGGGIAWIDPMLRVLVLWVGLLGAVAATREDRHITIDVLSRLLPERTRAGVGVVTSLCTAGVAGFIAYHATRFVASEFRFGSEAFSGVPAWAFQSVIPFAFAAIALRSLRLTADHLRAAFCPEPEESVADEGPGAGTG